MSNTSGAYPLDPTSQVGLFRFELGDVVATNIVSGTADYEALSDAAISALLTANPTAPGLAMSKALSSWANQLIAAAQDIVVDDIKIKTVEKASLLAARADRLAAIYNLADAASAFTVVGLHSSSDYRSGWVQGQPARDYLGAIQGRAGYIGDSGF